jgi:hypothetical protein
MINTQMCLTQFEIRYLLEHTIFNLEHTYLKKYLESRLKELVDKEGELS